jgi:uncharacterized protein (TIGR02594 family)
MTAKPKWLLEAEKDAGQKEYPGNWQDNPIIVDMFKYTTYKATHDEVPWCAAALNKWLAKAGIIGSKSAAAVSFLNWGIDLGEEPELGCIVVFEWANGGHHVALYMDGENNTIHCLGGNQSNMVKVSSFPVYTVMSYRWPGKREGYKEA